MVIYVLKFFSTKARIKKSIIIFLLSITFLFVVISSSRTFGKPKNHNA